MQKRWPRRPDRLTRSETLEAMYGLIRDANALGVSTATLSHLLRLLEMSPSPGGCRTFYEQARAHLFAQLQDLDPDPWQVQALDGVGFQYLSPLHVLERIPSRAAGEEAVAILAPDPPITPQAIDLATRRLIGLPTGKAGMMLRDAALAPLVLPLEGAGNGPAAIAAWLRKRFTARQIGWGHISPINVATTLRRLRQSASESG